MSHTMWVNEEAECVERRGRVVCELQEQSVCMSIVGGTMASGCSVCETKQRTSVVVCVMEVRGVREMMVWCGVVEKARVPVCCHSHHSHRAHAKCMCGLLCGGESAIGGEWRGKEQ